MKQGHTQQTEHLPSHVELAGKLLNLTKLSVAASAENVLA